MESSWKKPAAKMQSSRHAPEPTSQEAEASREIEEFQQAQAKAKTAEDKVGELIGGKWFVTHWTDPILFNPITNIQMTVHRFYPDIKVALDIFVNITDHEKSIIAMKKEIFKKNLANFGGERIRVRYAALDYSMPLANILPQLEAN